MSRNMQIFEGGNNMERLLDMFEEQLFSEMPEATETLVEDGKKAIIEYGAAVYKYVDGNLEVALTAETVNGRNIIGEAINEKANLDPNYRNLLVSKLAIHGIIRALPSYKAPFVTGIDKPNYVTLNAEDLAQYRRTVFMRQIYSCIHLKQIALWAEQYNKQISELDNRPTR